MDSRKDRDRERDRDRDRDRDYDREHDKGRDRTHNHGSHSSRRSSGTPRSSKEKEHSSKSSKESESFPKRLKSMSDAGGKRDDGGGRSPVQSRGHSPVGRDDSRSSSPNSLSELDLESTPKVISRKDIFDSYFNPEWVEAGQMDVDGEYEDYLMCCDEIESLLSDIRRNKHEPKEDIEDTKAEILFLFCELRKTNRLLKYRLKQSKDEIIKIREEVDEEYLVLQNLHYEAMHLANQISSVQELKGESEKIDLIPVSQFYEEAPIEISKPDKTKNDLHLQKIARLEYEYAQRKQLKENCVALEKSKESILKQCELTKLKLESVRPLINSILNATRPLQDYFGLNISKRKADFALAKFLPTPLFILYSQSVAMMDANIKESRHLIVQIGGDVEAAKEMKTLDALQPEESDSDMDIDADAEINSKRRKLKKRTSVVKTKEEMKRNLLQPHPLWVQWQLKCKSNDALLVQYVYLSKLGILAVKSKLIHPPLSEIKDPLQESDDLLCRLYKDDAGDESPNPANKYQLQEFDIDSISEFTKDFGKPFRWAQNLGGLQYLNSDEEDGVDEWTSSIVTPDEEICILNIQRVLLAIKKRLSSKNKLSAQLKALDSRNLQIPPSAKELFPSRNSATFVSWEQLTFKQYKEYKFTNSLVKSECVSENDFHYKAVIERGKAKMKALVSVGVDFPDSPPVFCVELEIDGEDRNAMNDSAIRDLEKELNLYGPVEFSDWSDHLMSLLILRLLYCTDVLLETDLLLGQSAGPSEFSREKLFKHPSKGKTQRRPYKYVSSGGGYFVQRY